jgi:hypothetical protein
MKQVKLIAALLLFVVGASAQTVTPDPGPYTPMNQKYEYRWIKTSGGLWNIGKFVQVDSAQFSGVTYVPSAASNDSSIKAANTGWVRRLFATASGSAGQWDTAGNAGLTDPRLGTTDNTPYAFVTNNIKRLIMPAAGILPASTDYVFLVKDTLNGELKYTTSAGGTFVPYTGATQDVNLGEFGLQTGNVEFDNTPTNLPTGAGSMYYNDTDGTLDLILKGANVKLQIGQESVIRVVNKTATNINLLEANYQAVRVTGAQGQRLKVDLAQATSDTLSAETIGLVTETINNNQEGFITTSGLVRNINTTGSLQSETWADGDIVYLSPTTAGRITNVKPSAPNHLVIIGYVIYAHATQGSIFVKVDNGYELDELHNVKITTPTNNQALIFNDTTDVWENKSLVTVSSYSKNATADSTILLLSDGTRYAAKDSIGGGAASQWVTNGSNIYYGTGKVGVTNASGTMTPTGLIHLENNTATGLNNSTDTTGLLLSTKTAATSTVVQNSPPFIISGNTWNTTTSGNENIRFRQIFTAQSGGSGSERGFYRFQVSTNGAAYTDIYTIGQRGAGLTYSGPMVINNSFSSTNSTQSGVISVTGSTSNSNSISSTMGQSFAGNSTNNVFAATGTLASTGGTKTWRGVYINPTLGVGSNLITRIGFQNTSGDNFFGSTSGSTSIGAGTTIDASAVLDVKSTTQGVLFPRMTTSEKNAIASPAAGLVVYDTTLNKLCVYTTAWETITSL